ncbi:histidinol dehydrogenase [Calothrix sp. NIES-3974]|uniref:histidinol dehydrogenase n=1 Tax=Calothrix sp. NIES-3974 TaxID=2005462 RepID=UPI000B5E36CA|nr:histidinol dehydrogenase [Calothrix sp. NIES-3974]BAZ05302.1 histidinol dehydrogenase [Calothrix sp. NIES-3974]
MLRIITQQTDVRGELQRICVRSGRDFPGEHRVVDPKGYSQDEQLLLEEKPRAARLHQEATVREILLAVKRQGNQAVIDYTAEFNGQILTPEELKVSGSQLDAAYQQVSKPLLKAIRLAARQIEAFHRQRVPKSWVHFGDDEVVLGKRYTPVDSAGIYIHGGRTAYPSAVLMNGIPAKVAGVPRMVMVTPMRGMGKDINPAILVAAQEVGIHEIYRIGGVQAIAAMAYGTETIGKVDLIVGGGDIYISLAKKQLFGCVGTDSLTETSEMVIIADDTANPINVATDLIAQAEREPMAAAILFTTDAGLAKNVYVAIERQLVDHPRRVETEKSLAHYGLIVVVESLKAAAELVNDFAPARLELQVEDAWEILPLIRHAGAIFLGHGTPEVVGDYLAGPSHTLPTCGSARFNSPLSVETFLKHSSIIQYSPSALRKIAGAIDILANADDFPSHADAVRRRLQAENLELDGDDLLGQ